VGRPLSVDSVVGYPPLDSDGPDVICRGSVQAGLLFSKFSIRRSLRGPWVQYPCRRGRQLSGPPDVGARRLLDELILIELRRQGWRLDAPTIRRQPTPHSRTHGTSAERRGAS
jgi:hypothetical protein